MGAISLYTNDRDVAQELAQDCLVRICRDWSKVQGHPNREAWAVRVGLNLANSFYRRRAAERRARERIDLVSTSVDPDWAAGVALRAALGGLPPRQRAVLIMRFYADMSFGDIAHEMNTGESTVKSLARRGLDRLRKDPAVPGIEGVELA